MKKNFPHISFCSVYKFRRQSFCIIIFDFVFVPFLFHNHVFLTILNSQHLENLPTNLTIFSFFFSLSLSLSPILRLTRRLPRLLRSPRSALTDRKMRTQSTSTEHTTERIVDRDSIVDRGGCHARQLRRRRRRRHL